jgi:hypothetical protein
MAVLEKLGNVLKEKGVEHEPLLGFGNPADRILETADARKPSLHRGRGGWPTCNTQGHGIGKCSPPRYRKRENTRGCGPIKLKQ